MRIPDKSALLVIDLQNDMSSTAIPVMKGSHCMQNAPRIIGYFREHGIPVIQVREMHRADMSDFGRELDGVEGVHCLEGTSAVEFNPATAPVEGEYTFGKRRYSAFLGTDLDLLLRCKGIENLFLIGGLTDVCVRFTAVDAHQYNYRFFVVTDCVTGSSWKAHEYALANMKYLQRESNITTADIIGEAVEVKDND